VFFGAETEGTYISGELDPKDVPTIERICRRFGAECSVE
jgi:hypothetical protein